MSKPLTQPKHLSFFLCCVMETGFVFDFETLLEERRYSDLLLEHLQNHTSSISWRSEGESAIISGSVDNYSPPKAGSFLCADVDNVLESCSIKMTVNGKQMELEMNQMSVHFYEFNCALLQFTVKIPESIWTDIPTLSRLRYFLQKHDDTGEEFETSLNSILSPLAQIVLSEFDNAVKVVGPPILETPFLDFAALRKEDAGILWSHPTLVAVMPKGFDPESEHYQKMLLDVSPGGIQNFALQPGIFTFVEAGDSLVCVPDISDDRGRSPQAIALEDWVYFLVISQYSWKTAWDLDRGLYVILNHLTSHLKHKHTARFRDVYAVNALINNISLLLDTLKPRNMTGTYYTVSFIERINQNWRTDEIIDAANQKMEALRQLIMQLDEIDAVRRDRRIEMFLTFVGVFALGSLVLDVIGAVSFASEIPDSIVLGLGLGIPSLFLIVAYYLLRS